MLNKIWPFFIIISIIFSFFSGKTEQLNDAIFESAKDTVNLCITLLGTICLWNGIMQIALKTRIIKYLKTLIKPLMNWLFPEINKEDKAYEEISMNMVANVLGLGNAATPMGLKAMQTLQEKNNDKATLSNEMFMFIVVNTASLQIIPTSVIAIRSSLRVHQPNRYDIGCMACHNWRIYICNCLCKDYNEKERKMINYISIVSIPVIILLIITCGVIEKIDTFDIFLNGVIEGIKIVVNIFPTLLGLLMSISLLRASGVVDLIVQIVSPVLEVFKIPSEIMPLALFRPVSR